MENFTQKLHDNINSVYYLLSIIAILYTAVNFFSNRIKKTSLFNVIKLIKKWKGYNSKVYNVAKKKKTSKSQ